MVTMSARSTQQGIEIEMPNGHRQQIRLDSRSVPFGTGLHSDTGFMQTFNLSADGSVFGTMSSAQPGKKTGLHIEIIPVDKDAADKLRAYLTGR